MTYWTDERVEILTRMWNAEETGNTIADTLGGTTRSAVVAKAHRLGLQSRINPTATDEAKFERLVDIIVDRAFDAPVSMSRASTIVGISYHTALEMWDAQIEATHGGEPA